MQQEMRKRMIAQQLAGSREAFNWYGSFYLVAVTGLTAGYVRMHMHTEPLLQCVCVMMLSVCGCV